MRLAYSFMALVCLASFSILCRQFVVVNITSSLPRGIYAYERGKTPAKGAYVVFDLPKNIPAHRLAETRGYLTSGRKLQKRVAAMPGDSYTLPHSCERDSQGRQLPHYEPMQGKVPRGMAVVLGLTSRSFDSRYFGPVPLKILKVVRPVFLIDKEML